MHNDEDREEQAQEREDSPRSAFAWGTAPLSALKKLKSFCFGGANPLLPGEHTGPGMRQYRPVRRLTIRLLLTAPPPSMQMRPCLPRRLHLRSCSARASRRRTPGSAAGSSGSVSQRSCVPGAHMSLTPPTSPSELLRPFAASALCPRPVCASAVLLATLPCPLLPHACECPSNTSACRDLQWARCNRSPGWQRSN